MGSLHSQVLDGIGAVASIAYFGFLGGYFGSVLSEVLRRDLEIDPIEAGEHLSAWVGLLAGLVVFIYLL